eukprot:GFKZ01001039.1.p1 GENE.GFKZ01001039.1~~GFKZ01001039.1.p1  ORF type:complete len:889 (-),score=129.49 GFKZ01001039.1:1480-4146(-)
MANRKSWKRALAPSPTPRPTPKHPTVFAGIADPNLNSTLATLVARDVVLRTMDGQEYTGLFSGTRLSNSASPVLQVHIRFARATAGKFHSSVSFSEIRRGIARELYVPLSHVAMVKAANPFAAVGANPASGFATDAQISRGSARVGRVLQRFDDFGDMRVNGEKPLDEQTFGDLAVNGGKKWDQFQVNHDKFGVTTTFDEDEYTTKIDRADAKYQEREREAARLAEEIEAKASDNVHVREERNQELGADYDEETLYSGVIRAEQSNATGAPSPLRSVSHSSQIARSFSHAAAPSRSKATSQAKDSAKEVKPLSYAAAAASSVRVAAAADQSVSTSKQITAPAGGAVGGKPSASKKPTSPRSATSANSASHGASQVKGGSGVGQGKTAGKAATAQKSAVQVKASATSKAMASQKAGTQGKNNSGSLSVNTSGTAGAKQKSLSAKAAKAGTDNKERDLLEKKPKLGPRDRSSRDNLPQLVKVRTGITGRTSPNQSRNSPLPTPATSDTSAVAVLNLDAQTPNIGPEQIKSFEKYKTKREIQSIAQNREKITHDLRKFSTELDSRNVPLRRANSNTSGNGTNSVSTPEKKVIQAGSKAEEKPAPAKVAGAKTPENRKPDAKVDKTPAPEPVAKPKPKIKSKLNPNAQEFKMNPDAPAFTPAAQEQPAMNHPPQAYNPYVGAPVVPEYSQPVPSAPQTAYPVPMQALGQIPYGQAYGVMMPGGVPTGVGAPTSAYQFVSPAPFPPSQVPSRFPQNAAVPASYGYGQINPTMPMVMGQAPQRLPSGPYGYYNSGPYPGGQVPGQVAPAPPMSPQAQQPMFAQTGQPGGIPHLQSGGIGMSRGGHGHARRGGGGRRGGKHQSHHGMGAATGLGSVEKAGSRTTDHVVPESLGQR